VTDTCLTSYNYFGVTHLICITCRNTHMAAHLLPLSHHIFSSHFSSQLTQTLSLSLTPISGPCSKPSTAFHHGQAKPAFKTLINIIYVVGTVVVSPYNPTVLQYINFQVWLIFKIIVKTDNTMRMYNFKITRKILEVHISCVLH